MAVSGRTVMLVAGLGIAVNLAAALLFLTGRRTDLNVRSAPSSTWRPMPACRPEW